MFGRARWLLLGVAAGLLLPAAPAVAGTYKVFTCVPAAGNLNDAWLSSRGSASYVALHSGCGEAPVLLLSAALANLAVGDQLLSGNAPVGQGGGWRITAPLGTAIRAIEGEDSIYKEASNDWYAGLEDAAGQTVDGQTCFVNLSAGGYCELSGRFQALGLDTSYLQMAIRCDENSFRNCPDGSTLHDVRAELDWAAVTIEDAAAPEAVSAQAVSGGGGQTLAVKVSATDRRAGLAVVEAVDAAGEVVGRAALGGQCDYTYVTPCPSEVRELPIALETAKLPAGSSSLSVIAVNAAGVGAAADALGVFRAGAETGPSGSTGATGPVYTGGEQTPESASHGAGSTGASSAAGSSQGSGAPGIGGVGAVSESGSPHSGGSGSTRHGAGRRARRHHRSAKRRSRRRHRRAAHRLPGA